MTRRLTALFGLTVVCLFLLAGPAFGHAVLQQSEPTNGAVLKAGPTRVQLWFSESVEAEFSPLTVLDQQGVQVDRGNAGIDPSNPRSVLVDLKELPEGFYTVSYRVISGGDGHVVTGALGFTVGTVDPAAPAPDPAAAVTKETPPAVSIVHGTAQFAAVALAGLVAFVALVWLPVSNGANLAGTAPRIFAPWIWVAFAMLLIAGLMEIALYAVMASGEPFSLELMGQALARTRVGGLWLIRLLFGLLVAIGASWAFRARRAVLWWLPLALGGLLLGTVSFQSHGASAGLALPLLADWVHLLAAAPWMGGLVGFVVALAGHRVAGEGYPPDFLRNVVRRFSRIVLVSVVLLAITGLYGALLHLSGWDALINTPYGKALVVKLVLLVPLLLLGGLNLIRQGRGPLRRTVWGELLLAMAIFVAVGFLTTLPPPGAVAVLYQGPFEQTVEQDGMQITLRVAPNQVGANASTISLRRSDGRPIVEANVGLRVTMLDHDMGRQNLAAVEQGNGAYGVEPLILGMAGTWEIEVVVLTKEGREVRLPLPVKVSEQVQR